MEYRRITDKTLQEFEDKFNNQPILDAKAPEDAVCQLNNQLQSTLDAVAPLITKKRSKHKNPYYDKQLNDQRRIFKYRERKWPKYKMQDL